MGMSVDKQWASVPENLVREEQILIDAQVEAMAHKAKMLREIINQSPVVDRVTLDRTYSVSALQDIQDIAVALMDYIVENELDSLLLLKDDKLCEWWQQTQRQRARRMREQETYKKLNEVFTEEEIAFLKFTHGFGW